MALIDGFIADFDLSDPSTITVDESGNVLAVKDKSSSGFAASTSSVFACGWTQEEWDQACEYYARLIAKPPDETH